MYKGISGIYKISSKRKPQKCYIGSTKNLKKRWQDHLINLRVGHHHSPKLQTHYNKYGKDDLIFEIITACDVSELLEKEQFFIDMYKPWFNVCITAGNRLGMKHTEETKEKCRIASTGKKHSEETREKCRIAGAKKVFTEETIEKLRLAQLGKHHSEETRAKLKIARNKRPPMSEETKRKISEGNKGRTLTQEQREKIRESLKQAYREGRHPKTKPWKHL
jgi:group I intron endonuclease